ncbi:IS66 family insertion sequence element accessory protein TnpA [Blautia liquoris]|uniref:IS66 family insertion sequence element accessory protein TnpA n=1 Tax=Blautia liquoris TaxID=2779518 RepID=UPI0038CC081F
MREQQASGLTIKAWCYQNHFTKDQYYYWKRLLKEVCLEATLPEIVQVPLPIGEEGCPVARVLRSFAPLINSITRSDLNLALKFLLCLDIAMNPFFLTDFSISDSLKSV